MNRPESELARPRPTDTLIDTLLSRVSADRLRDLTLDLVRIPSPTGDSLEVTKHYGEVVRSLGLPVEVMREYPHSPSTIARYGCDKGATTLTLVGHLDTIHTSHAPACDTSGRVYGRGAGDMKSGIAAMVEAARVLVESNAELGGNLILATHSLHELPMGHMEGLRGLIARGDVFTGAALVAECGFDELFIRGKGQAVFEINITREGSVLHENVARSCHVPNPLDYAAQLAARITARSEELAAHGEPLLGPETFFLGQIHGGDFYNRVPTRAHINGTYRCWPDKGWSDIQREFGQLLESTPRDPALQADLRTDGNGLGWEMSPKARIVSSIRGAYRTVTGDELPLAGATTVCDVNVIVREARIPAVSHGTGTTTAHADVEWVDMADVVRTTRVYLGTIINYLGLRGCT